MPNTTLTIEQVLTLLRATPLHLAVLTADLAPEALQARPSPDEWSANEVLAHLRACADVWGTCIEAILTQEMPTLRAINPRSWIEQTNYLDLGFGLSLGAFATQRADLLAALSPLPSEVWERSATVRGAGKVLSRTALFYAQWLAGHERPHVKQIERVVKPLQR
ncbi:MAG: hypothetical protein NVS4B11_02490 [Ktedonobacteraceae bacterium]